jgi:hypothetical protein
MLNWVISRAKTFHAGLHKLPYREILSAQEKSWGYSLLFGDCRAEQFSPLSKSHGATVCYLCEVDGPVPPLAPLPKVWSGSAIAKHEIRCPSRHVCRWLS